MTNTTGDAAHVGDPPPLPRSWLGYLVHAYTASGLILVALATHLILEERFAGALVALLACIFIDATDGALARRLRVKESAPRINGRTLDDIVDYLSFVFVPLLLAVRAGLLLEPAIAVVAVAMIASAFGFSRVDAKLEGEGFFVGFPSYWSIVVGYMWVFDTPAAVNTALILALAILVLVPIRFLYVTRIPDRGERHRHYVFSMLCSLICVVALLMTPGAARTAVAVATLAYPAYYVYCSVRGDIADRRRRRASHT